MADIRQIIAHTRAGGFRPGEFTFPNSHRGLNRKDSLADMPVDHSIEQVNLISRAGYTETRPGSVLHTTLAVSDVLIEDTSPPRLASKPPLYIRDSDVRFEIPLLDLLEAEVEPMLFSLVSASDSFLKVSEHGVLYGRTPQTTETLTHQAEIRVRDPARNALEFTVRMVILPLQRLPTPVVVPATLATPGGLTVSRYPRNQSELVKVDFDPVTGGESYQIRYREKGSGTAGWMVDEQPATYVILDLPGAVDGPEVKWEVRVRALKAEGETDGASPWSDREDVPDQEGIGITLEQLNAFRQANGYDDQVQLQTQKARGVIRYSFQFQQSGGDWTDGAGGAAGSKATAMADANSPTVSLTRDLGGAGWKFRLPNFASADVEEGYEPPQQQGVEYQIPDQLKAAPVANFAASRNPDDTNASVRFTWDQHAQTGVTGYSLEISQNGTKSDTLSEDFTSRATVQADKAMAGTGWTARIRPTVPTGWLEPDWVDIDVDDQETTTSTAQLVATNLTAERQETTPENLHASVEVSWTPAAGNTRQVLETKQGRGAWTDAGVALTPSTDSATLTLRGSGWRLRLGTFDTQSPAQRRNVKLNVDGQVALGEWYTVFSDEGTRTIGDWVRSNPQDLSEVAVSFHRVSPLSVEAGKLEISAGGKEKEYSYLAAATAIDATENLGPGEVSFEDMPGANFLAPPVKTATGPSRPAMTIRSLGFTRPAAGSFTTVAATNADVNKNVTLTWDQVNDRDNREKYTIEIKRKKEGSSGDFAAVTPISGPTYDAATGKWTAVCDADQRVGGTLTTTRWQFQVAMKGYSETPDIGSPYTVSDSASLVNTAPNHDAPMILTTLSATIAGPENILKATDTTYTATVTGGSGPLTYAWTVTGTLVRIVGSSNGSSVVVRADRPKIQAPGPDDPPPTPEPVMVSFFLSLVVTRGGATATATLTGSAYVPVTSTPTVLYTGVGNTIFSVSWTAVFGATAYEYRYRTRSGESLSGSEPSWSEWSAVTRITGRNVSLASFEAGTQFQHEVRGVNPASTGPGINLPDPRG